MREHTPIAAARAHGTRTAMRPRMPKLVSLKDGVVYCGRRGPADARSESTERGAHHRRGDRLMRDITSTVVCRRARGVSYQRTIENAQVRDAMAAMLGPRGAHMLDDGMP